MATEFDQRPVPDLRFLSGNMLKIIAAALMTVDHVGLVIFPKLGGLRIIGRLAFPIFAFMIAEGCKYTKNRLRYFSGVFILGVICQAAYSIYSQSHYIGILLTFSVSIAIVYALQNMKETVFSEASKRKKIISVCVFFGSVFAAFILNLLLDFDYGFFGMMVPVFAGLFESESELPANLKKLGLNTVRVLTMGIGLLLMVVYYGNIAYYALLALPLLLFYSGRRGKLKMKYFFYIFYPAHLLIINGINFLI